MTRLIPSIPVPPTSLVAASIKIVLDRMERCVPQPVPTTTQMMDQTTVRWTKLLTREQEGW